MKTPISLMVFLTVVMSLSACETSTHGYQSSIPMGRLGHPIGTYLRIEGTRLEKGKVNDHTLLVDRINGTELSPPIGISLNNVEALPSSVRCRVSGYESGQWIGLPPDVARAENLRPQQAAWQFYRYFIVTSVQEPAALVEKLLEAMGTR